MWTFLYIFNRLIFPSVTSDPLFMDLNLYCTGNFFFARKLVLQEDYDTQPPEHMG